MRVLVTGGAGFIGSHLVEHYLADGHEIAAVDNLLTGSLDNFQTVSSHRRFHFLRADTTADWDNIREFVSERIGGVDLILRFASPASPVDYANHPLATLTVNSLGTQYCCRAALDWGARLLYASTSECYGDPTEHPRREEYWGNVNPNGPRSCYDEAKRYGEALVFAYIRTYGLDARVVRIFNTYGPRIRRDDGRVVPNFVAQAVDGQPLTVYGDGRQTRSFCDVDDLSLRGLFAVRLPRGRAVSL